MLKFRRFSPFLPWLVLALCACKAQTQTPTPLQSITAPQGGKIVYGTVDGATTQAAAMSFILRNVHNNCGEKPQVGQVFQFRGTNSVGVFFTVTNHPGGNKKVAGLVIANATGPRQVDAALLSDDALRFGQTVNPMMQQLFSVWHPGGAGAATSGSPAGAKADAPSGSAGGGGSAPAAALRTVTAPDYSASVGIPDGWKLDPNSGHGAVGIHGPNGEQISLTRMKGAIDPTHPFRARSDAYGQLEGPPGAVVIYPYRGDPAKEFEGILQAWRRSNGKGPVRLQGLKTQIVDNPLPDTNQCATADGQVDLQDGTGMQKLGALLCVYDEQATFRQWGNYVITFYQLSFVPMAVAQKDSALISAIADTYKQNNQVMQQQGQHMQQAKQQSDQQIMAQSQAAVDRIHQIGAQAAAQMNSAEAAHDAQNAAWNASQVNNARNNQGFSNYLLDQSVVQNNNVGGTGAVGHATVWNSTANALVQADPNRFAIVNTPNYWQGTDF
jgi:hypothetical protein